MTLQNLRVSWWNITRSAKLLFGKLHTEGFILRPYQQCIKKSSVSGSKVLSLSSILLQDGLEIKELPLLIRKIDQSMFSHGGPMESFPMVKKMTSEDVTFREKLHGCCNVKEVFKLLEVPTDNVTGYSAAFTLQKICQLQDVQENWDDIHSFIQTAVMNELYETVKKEVSTLTNETVISLVRCYLRSENFSTSLCSDTIQEEVEKRIGDSKFTILEACHLSSILFPYFENTKDLIEKLWIHVASRYKDINESNICVTYRCLPSFHKYVSKLVDKQFLQCWWKLTGADISSITLDIIRLQSPNRRHLQNVGKWVCLNFHDVTEAQMTQILAGFLHFSYFDVNLMKALERYIPARIETIGCNLIALVMEYCCSQRYLSIKIFDSVASNFVKCGQKYAPLQVYSVLRPFGQLNYQPSMGRELFSKAEEVLTDRFLEFSFPNLVELLCSFAYIQRFPLNFINVVLTPSFLTQIKKVPHARKQMEVGLWLEKLQSALILETKNRRIPHLFKMDQNYLINTYPRSLARHRQVYAMLVSLLGVNKVDQLVLIPKTIYWTNFEIHVDENKEAVPMSSYASKDTITKNNLKSLMMLHNPGGKTRLNQATQVVRVMSAIIALSFQMPEHYCINMEHLLGEFAMRNRHLKLLGYSVLEIPCELQRLPKRKRLEFLKYYLQPFVNIPKKEC